MTKLRDQVSEFMTAFEQARRDTPGAPDPATVRLRARLIAEETFELLAALYAGTGYVVDLQAMRDEVMELLDLVPPETPDIVEFADACADLDYVVAGARLAFGIDGGPIADEVHRSNMAKVGGHVDEHGKKRKPPGWTPPDIAGCLRKQGWEPPR